MRCAVPVAALAFLAGTASPAAAAPTVVPYLNLFQGYNDNVTAVPDEPPAGGTPAGAARERDTFVLLQPGARALVPLRPGLAAGLQYRLDWERYDRTFSGESAGHLASVNLTAGGEGPTVEAFASYAYQAVPQILNDRREAYLNHHAGRGGLAFDLPLGAARRFSLNAGASYLARRYPRYEVVTNAAFPGSLDDRADGVLGGSAGAAWRPSGPVSVRAGYQIARTRGNALLLQAGSYRDFFSSRSQGGFLAAGYAPVKALRLDATVQGQRSLADARLVPGTGVPYAATVTSATFAALWKLSPGVGLSLEVAVARNAANDPRASFRDRRVLAGLVVSDVLRGGGPAAGPGAAPPPDTEARIADARRKFDDKEYVAAADLAEDILRADPTSWRAWGLLGNAYYQSADADAALHAYRQSLALHPDNPQLASWVARIGAKPEAPPAAPAPSPVQGVAPPPSPGGIIVISWNAARGDVGGYHVYLALAEGGKPAGPAIRVDPVPGGATVTTAIDAVGGRPLEPGRTYFVTVRAFKGKNGSVEGPPVLVTSLTAAAKR